jgi:hypothetical protein
MTKPPAEPPKDPNLAGFRAILEAKKKKQVAADVAKPSDLTHKQKPRPKEKMRRRP